MMRTIRKFGFAEALLFGLPAIAVLAGCGGGSFGTNGFSSGIQGAATLRVVGGPPVVNANPTGGTVRTYPGAVITIQPSGGGAEVVRTTADAQGSFQFSLVPGTYRIVPLMTSSAISPLTSTQEVTVSRSQFTQVTVEYEEFAP